MYKIFKNFNPCCHIYTAIKKQFLNYNVILPENTHGISYIHLNFILNEFGINLFKDELKNLDLEFPKYLPITNRNAETISNKNLKKKRKSFRFPFIKSLQNENNTKYIPDEIISITFYNSNLNCIEKYDERRILKKYSIHSQNRLNIINNFLENILKNIENRDDKNSNNKITIVEISKNNFNEFIYKYNESYMKI